MNAIDLRCTVVIPTRGGQPALDRAIGSVLSQHGVDVEVLVVRNGSGTLPAIADARVRFLESDPAARGNGARNRGISEARFPWVAFLDDDDWWAPTKLAEQLQRVAASGCSEHDAVVLTGQLREAFPDGSLGPPLPPEDPGEIIDAAGYLFRRALLRSARPQLQSSTLLTSTGFARAVPFDESLRLHQDWDWVINCTEAGAVILHVHLPLTFRSVDVGGSVSSSIRWMASRDWAERRLAGSGRRVRGDYALTVLTGYALAEQDPAAFRATWRWAWRHGTPSPGAIVYFIRSRLSLRRRETEEKL